MLDEENANHSTSALVAKEIVPASDLPKQAMEVPEGQPGPGALTGGGPSTDYYDLLSAVLSGRFAQCAHLSKIALNTLSGSGAVRCL
ncbi:hypothetical protein PanWU01x14_336930 [Parasponia andersonii]|uniref:Uncharacterized protein n=1 Tax=Parasponia andersonii TaxID=3476 RepID=A0A2P5AFQ5_PARAD|nr:hypothetical protein PanWU01x14_336930 [Parasponia andersonii]